MTDPTREAFEAWISAPPFEQSVSRLNASSAWPGSYQDIATDLAWQAWQAALSARAQGEWLPIESAPKDEMVVVAWLEGEDSESPERMAFDRMEDGVWLAHSDLVEHAEAVAPPGSRMPTQEAPYMWWLKLLPLPAAPKQQAVEVGEEVVERALAAYNASRGTYSGEVPTDRDDIRAALLAALAQQGREVGEAVAIGTVKIERGREGAPGMKWAKLDLDLLNTLPVGTPLYTAAPKQQAVDDAMLSHIAAVIDGTLATCVSDATTEERMYAGEQCLNELANIRDALLAALPGKTEVDRG